MYYILLLILYEILWLLWLFLLMNNCRSNDFVLLCSSRVLLLFVNRKLIMVVGLNERLSSEAQLDTQIVVEIIILNSCLLLWGKNSFRQEEDYILCEWKSYGLNVVSVWVCTAAHIGFNWLFLNYLSILIICVPSSNDFISAETCTDCGFTQNVCN